MTKFGAIVKIIPHGDAELVNPVRFKQLEPSEQYPMFSGTQAQLHQEAVALSKHLASGEKMKREYISHEEDGTRYIKARITIYDN